MHDPDDRNLPEAAGGDISLRWKLIQFGAKFSEPIHDSALLFQIEVDTLKAPLSVPAFVVPSELARIRNWTVIVDWQYVQAEALERGKHPLEDRLCPCCPDKSSNSHILRDSISSQRSRQCVTTGPWRTASSTIAGASREWPVSCPHSLHHGLVTFSTSLALFC
jgi:hypothetical protein